MVYLRFCEPILPQGVGFTSKIRHTFVTGNGLRPYMEFSGGPFWTDLGDYTIEMSSKHNQRSWCIARHSHRRGLSTSAVVFIASRMPKPAIRILVSIPAPLYLVLTLLLRRFIR